MTNLDQKISKDIKRARRTPNFIKQYRLDKATKAVHKAFGVK